MFTFELTTLALKGFLLLLKMTHFTGIIIEEVKKAGNTENARAKTRYFKIIGEDVFWGVSNPDIQKIFKKYEKNLNNEDLESLLQSSVHEIRYGALILLVRSFERTSNVFDKQQIVNLYLKHKAHINNWDLVDCSCYKILGPWQELNPDHEILENLMASDNIWEKRMAMVSTLHFIKKKLFFLALKFSKDLLDHPEDLLQKALGWMLKETWDRGGADLVEDFLNEHKHYMNRTALRYAIEKMPTDSRKHFLEK